MYPAENIKSALLEMDDAELGKAIKENVGRFVDNDGNLASHVYLAARVLVACTHLSGSISIEQVMKDQEIKGDPIGNFIVKIERVKDD